MLLTNQLRELNVAVAVALSTILLTACGGGGSDDSGDTNTTDEIKKPVDVCSDASKKSNQPDLDADGVIDACDDDIDNDGVANTEDAVPDDSNVVGISRRSYSGDVYASYTAYFDSKSRLIKYDDNKLYYDDQDRLIRMESFDGSQLSDIKIWEYNQDNELSTHKVDKDADGKFEQTTTYNYNEDGHLTKVVAKGEDTNFYSSDTYTTYYAYNDDNQLIKIEKDFLSNGVVDRQRELSYNDKGYLAQSKLSFIEYQNDLPSVALYRTMDYTYDSESRLIEKAMTYAGGSFQSDTYVYDIKGNLIQDKKYDRFGNIELIDTTIQYNSDNLPVRADIDYTTSLNMRDVAITGDYDNQGYLIQRNKDDGKDGTDDVVVKYAYEGLVPIEFNNSEFYNVYPKVGRSPTATNNMFYSLRQLNADTVIDSCFDNGNVYTC